MQGWIKVCLIHVDFYLPGMCVADPVSVSVNLQLSINVPLPYQVVKGEQLELQGSVFNRQDDIIRVPTTLSTTCPMMLCCPSTEITYYILKKLSGHSQ